jgi:hypothetical protein
MNQTLANFVKAMTLFVAEVAFLGLVISFVWRTATAKTGMPPDLPDVQVSAAGALAIVLGGGYALTLGVPSSEALVKNGVVATVGSLLSEKLWLSLGVVFYLAAGIAACITYGLSEAETPGILKTIAVGFGGYVIAYIGMAYRQLSNPG